MDIHFALKLVSVKLEAFGAAFPTFSFGFAKSFFFSALRLALEPMFHPVSRKPCCLVFKTNIMSLPAPCGKIKPGSPEFKQMIYYKKISVGDKIKSKSELRNAGGDAWQ